jgi:hypothetical protein
MSYKLSDYELQLAVKEIPEIWEEIKSNVKYSETTIELNYLGFWKGKPLSVNILKFRRGNIFDVYCELDNQDISEYLRNHITNKK